MPGPGEYLADKTQGITRVEDLPKPKPIRRSRNYKRRPCPLCQHNAYRLRTRDHISQRIAMDMRRDEYIIDVKKTLRTLHWSRNCENRKAG